MCIQSPFYKAVLTLSSRMDPSQSPMWETYFYFPKTLPDTHELCLFPVEHAHLTLKHPETPPASGHLL